MRQRDGADPEIWTLGVGVDGDSGRRNCWSCTRGAPKETVLVFKWKIERPDEGAYGRLLRGWSGSHDDAH